MLRIYFWHNDNFWELGRVSIASCDRRNRSPFWLELRSGLCGARDRGQRPCVVPDRRGPVSGVVIVCAIMNKFRVIGRMESFKSSFPTVKIAPLIESSARSSVLFLSWLV